MTNKEKYLRKLIKEETKKLLKEDAAFGSMEYRIKDLVSGLPMGIGGTFKDRFVDILLELNERIEKLENNQNPGPATGE